MLGGSGTAAFGRSDGVSRLWFTFAQQQLRALISAVQPDPGRSSILPFVHPALIGGGRNIRYWDIVALRGSIGKGQLSGRKLPFRGSST